MQVRRTHNIDCYCLIQFSHFRSQWPRGLVGLRPLACWGRGFESHRGLRRLSVVIVVCCRVEVELITRAEESYRLWCVVVEEPYPVSCD